MSLSCTAHLSQSQFWQAHKVTLAKKMLLKTFFEKGEWPSDETTEDSMIAKKEKFT